MAKNQKKPIIDNEFWDDMVPEDQEPTPKKTQKQKSPSKPKLVRYSILMPPELIERIKNCVYHTPGLTVAKLSEEVFGKAIDQREKKLKMPFPKRPTNNLETGRPLS